MPLSPEGSVSQIRVYDTGTPLSTTLREGRSAISLDDCASTTIGDHQRVVIDACPPQVLTCDHRDPPSE